MNERTPFDVAVVGLGAMGSMALWQLAQRGVDAIGFEQYEPGHSLGSSHGESRIIRTAYFEGPQYVPLVRRSFDLWDQLEQAAGEQLLIRTGALMIGPPGSELIEGTLQSVREHNLSHEILNRAEMSRRFPQHRLAPEDIAIFEEPAGVLFPERAVRAAVRQAAALGAAVATNTRVEQIEAGPEGVSISAGGRDYHARHAVLSVGPWLPQTLSAGTLPLTVTRQVLSWLPVEDATFFDPGRFPVFMHHSGEHQWYGFPSLDGETVKLAVHHEGSPTTPEVVNREAAPGDYALLERLVSEGLHGVEPRVVRNQVCLYTNTPDFHFLVGPSPMAEDITVLGGFSGHGFKFAPVIGEIAADLSVAGSTRHAIEAFAPDRFTSRL